MPSTVLIALRASAPFSLAARASRGHPVRARYVELERVGAGLLHGFRQMLPVLSHRGVHDAGPQGPAGEGVLDLGDLLLPLPDRHLRGELDILHPNGAFAV